MPAGEGALEDDGVGAVVLALPAAADEIERPGRRDDGDERGAACGCTAGSESGRPAPETIASAPASMRGAHRGHVVALERHHDVDAGEPAAGLGRLDLEPHRLVGADLAAEAPADYAVETGARHQPETAGDGDGRSQRSK